MLSINTSFGITASDYVYSDLISLVRNTAVPSSTVEGFSSKASRLDAATAVASLFAASGSSLYRTTMVSGLSWTAPAQERVYASSSDTVSVESLLPSLSVTVSTPKATLGDTILVPVYAKQETGAGGSFDVYFYEDIASFVSYEADDGVTVRRTKDGLSVTLTAKPVTGRAVLTLQMRVSASLPAGTHTYLTCLAAGKTDTADASIRVYAKGDVTMDGKINNADALAIEKHVVKLSSLSDAQAVYADVNGDGKADARDAMRILQMIAASSR